MNTISNNELLEALRQTAAFANAQRLKAQQALQEFESHLEATGTPLHHLPPTFLGRFSSIEKLHTTRVKNFLAATVALKSFSASQPEPPPPPPQPVVLEKMSFRQTVEVTIVDGQTHSRIDSDAHHWLPRLPLASAQCFIRHYFFPNAQVPAEYAFVLQHQGLHYPPTRSVYITYTPEEFKRLCQLELDTNSPHLLDGDRIGYKRFTETSPIPPPSDPDPPD